MKRIIFGFIFIIVSAYSGFAQIGEARKVDELEGFCCEQLRGVLDNFLVEVQNNPEVKGYVIFYGGKNHPICNTNRIPKRDEINIIIETFKNHVKFRNQDISRFAWVNGGYRENWTAEFWIVPNNADVPKPTPTVKEKDIKFKRGKTKKLDLRCEP